MRLGIDFDNTIVCYDGLFHRVALEGGWIPADLPANKSDVRNHLRQIGREDVWTEMQGRVYGPRLTEASPFPGVLEFFKACRLASIPVCIISHKTKTPFAGEPYDLHQAALDWLTAQGFFDPAGIGLPRSQVFLELTKQAKLQRIAACECTHFIDDLPEFLAEASFPPRTMRILFDPNRLYGPEIPFTRLHAWSEADAFLTPQPPASTTDLLHRVRVLLSAGSHPAISRGPESANVGPSTSIHPFPPVLRPALNQSPEAGKASSSSGPITLEPLPGGANNRVYLVQDTNNGDAYVLKRYFQSPDDPRDRFGTELALYRWAEAQGIRRTPTTAGWDVEHRLALFRFVEGRKLRPGEPEVAHVEQAAAFIVELNAARYLSQAQVLPIASEACFSLAGHLDRIETRIERLEQFEPGTPLEREAAAWIQEQLVPRWHAVREHILRGVPAAERERSLDREERCISPSDFGFHNALLTADGTLRFLDFEYAGWDDPAKLVCDFFCQPKIPVEDRFWTTMVQALDQGLGWKNTLEHRAHLLLPAYRLKWCCILLNEFLRTGSARRTFASTDLGTEERKAAQLAKAQEALRRVRLET